MITSISKLTVCIVGGGNSAHVLIPFLSTAGHNLHLLTRRPNDWNDVVTCDLTTMENKVTKTFTGTCSKTSSDPKDVIPDADAIILCMPVHQYRNALDSLAPYINQTKVRINNTNLIQSSNSLFSPDSIQQEEVFVGTIYGQAGFNWMVHEMEREHKLSNVVCFAVGLIPWICRTTKYGSHVHNYGGKQVNICAVTPSQKFDKLNTILLQDFSWNPMGIGKFVQACSFLSLTLSVDNQIIHPSRCFGLWKEYGGKWASVDQVPYFYREFDDTSTEILTNIDNDYSAVRAAVRKHFPDRPFTYMLSYLDLERLTHRSKHPIIKASFRNSSQLGLVKTPTLEGEDGTRVLNTQCRFFTDDIPYGLLLAKWVAEQLDVKTPHLNVVIMWAQKLRGEHWLNDDSTIDMEFCTKHKHHSGLPPTYGINNVDEILD